MKTKIKIESIFGKLLFEHEAENNTIKKTLEEAVKSGAYLGGADLLGANLGGEWGKLESVSDVLMVGPIGSRDGYTPYTTLIKAYLYRVAVSVARWMSLPRRWSRRTVTIGTREIIRL